MAQVADSKSIIGISVNFNGLEVAQNTFPKMMNWDDAKVACATLGPGWRLPTKDELYLLYMNNNKFGFAMKQYWSCDESGGGGINYNPGEDDDPYRMPLEKDITPAAPYRGMAWVYDFSNQVQYGKGVDDKRNLNLSRAVRVSNEGIKYNPGGLIEHY